MHFKCHLEVLNFANDRVIKTLQFGKVVNSQADRGRRRSVVTWCLKRELTGSKREREIIA